MGQFISTESAPERLHDRLSIVRISTTGREAHYKRSYSSAKCLNIERRLGVTAAGLGSRFSSLDGEECLQETDRIKGRSV